MFIAIIQASSDCIDPQLFKTGPTDPYWEPGRDSKLNIEKDIV